MTADCINAAGGARGGGGSLRRARQLPEGGGRATGKRSVPRAPLREGLGVAKDAVIGGVVQGRRRRGFAKAQNNLGALYDGGEGVGVDHGAAAFWYEKAAAQGNASALNNHGILHEDGVVDPGRGPDLTRARELYAGAAALGHAHALNNLGYLCMVSDATRSGATLAPPRTRVRRGYA